MSTCNACHLDEEEREARCSACPCIERAELYRSSEHTQKVAANAAAALELGLDGTIPYEQAYHDAFITLYDHLYGPGEAVRIIAEGKRMAP